jgi:hypothetical protein
MLVLTSEHLRRAPTWSCGSNDDATRLARSNEPRTCAIRVVQFHTIGLPATYLEVASTLRAHRRSHGRSIARISPSACQHCMKTKVLVPHFNRALERKSKRMSRIRSSNVVSVPASPERENDISEPREKGAWAFSMQPVHRPQKHEASLSFSNQIASQS